MIPSVSEASFAQPLQGGLDEVSYAGKVVEWNKLSLSWAVPQIPLLFLFSGFDTYLQVCPKHEMFLRGFLKMLADTFRILFHKMSVFNINIWLIL